MNEFDAIVHYLEKKGLRVSEVRYFQEYNITNTAVMFYLGVKEGYDYKQILCVGCLEIYAQLSGTIVLTNQNSLNTKTYMKFPGMASSQECNRIVMSIGNGLNPLGNNEYQGWKRVYNVGLNHFELVMTGCGSATLDYTASFNGFLFALI
jgi:uncharacterized protein YkuJ